jgi:Secretion system C-terminal sorting domain
MDYSKLATVKISPLPEKYELMQNFPNPFNPTTTVRYNLPRSSTVKLEVYSILGQRVAVLVNSKQNAGNYTFVLDGSRYQLASGMYFYRMIASDDKGGRFIETKKMLLIK